MTCAAVIPRTHPRHGDCRAFHFMDGLNRIMSRYPVVTRWAWAVILLVLAACNEGSDGGGPGY
jgi:hypothetical protein